ncbi:MAG: S24 family peptidase [Verrucomicrobiota bacterium]
MAKEKKTTSINFRLEPSIISRVEKLERATGQTRAYIARQALEAALELFEREKEISFPLRFPEIEKSSEKITSLEENLAELRAEIRDEHAADFAKKSFELEEFFREQREKMQVVADHLQSEIFYLKREKTTPYLDQKPHLLAAAGSPLAAEVLNWEGSDNTVHVKICGLSMVPLMHDGEVIAMRHKRAARNPYMKKGLIYLVEYDGGYTVKRYNTRPAKPEEQGQEWVERGRVKVLESINPDFPEIVIKQAVEWVAWFDPKGNE